MTCFSSGLNYLLLTIVGDVYFFIFVIEPDRRELDYDDVYNQTGPTNSTVYCGGILSDLTGR